MDSCPNEILMDIVQILSKPDLLTLRLVGRRLKDVATCPAFTQLNVYDNTLSAQRFSSMMVECDDSMILHAVDTLIFDGTTPDHFDIGSEPTPIFFENAFSLLYRFPNLQNLTLDFFSETHPEKNQYISYYLKIQLVIWTSLSGTPLPRLRTLRISSMATYFPHLLDEMDQFLALFRSLTTLSLSVISIVKASGWPGEVLTINPNVTCMLCAASNITSLQLGASVLAGPTSPFSFETLLFPALTSLVLHTTIFAGLPDGEDPPEAPLDGQRLTVETFILNHKATLQCLVLRNCAVPVLNGAWHRVLKRFRFELSELVEFIWIVRGPQPSKQFLYARPIGQLHTYEVADDGPIPDDQQDVGALEDLQTKVMLQRNNMHARLTGLL
ncbi:hypothetical protein B0H19DRAFT_327291 [Mycena capillaripes]|nr:hypothetical protein B0H19DRAFT_327291 [Mycena capillaripes]